MATTMDVSVVLRLIDDLTGPARKAAESLQKLQQQITSMSRHDKLFEGLPANLRKTASAAQHAGKQLEKLTSSFAKAEGAARGIKFATGMGIKSTWISAQTQQLNTLTRAANRASQATRSAHASGLGKFFAGAGMIYGAHQLGHGAQEGLMAGFGQDFSIEQTKALLGANGESQATIAQVVAAAQQMAIGNTQFSTADHAKSILELRSVIGDMGEAMKLAPAFQQANAILASVRDQNPGLHGMDFHSQARDFARALEIKGVMQQGEEAINSYMNSMTKAIIAFGGQIDASDFHMTFKYGRAATRGWSQEFVEQFLPTIMNELKGKGGRAGSAGNALMSMYQAVVSGKMTKGAMAEWDNLGLLEKDKVIRNKKGGIEGIMEGGVKDWRKFMKNPYLYASENLLDAIRKHNPGADEEKIISVAGHLFGNRVAEQVAQIMLIQGKQFEKDARLVRMANGFDGLSYLQEKSPQAAIQGFVSAFRDMAGAISSPLTQPAITALHGLAGAMRAVSAAASGSEHLKEIGANLQGLINGLFGRPNWTLDDPSRKEAKRGWATQSRREHEAQSDPWYKVGQDLAAAATALGSMARKADEIAGKMGMLGAAIELAVGGLLAWRLIKLPGTLLKNLLGFPGSKPPAGPAGKSWLSTLLFGGGLPGWIARIGAAFSVGAAGFTQQHQDPIRKMTQNPLGGALGGDYSIGAWAMAPPEQLAPYKPNPNAAMPWDYVRGWFRKPAQGKDFTLGATSGFSKSPTFTNGGFGYVPDYPMKKAGEKSPLMGSLDAVKQLGAQLDALIPAMNGKGLGIMQGIAEGMQQGAAAVTGKVQNLMQELQSIAAAGITIPIRADTSGAAAAVQGAMQSGAAARFPAASSKPGVTQHNTAQIHVHGTHDARATAQEVHRRFAESVSSQLNDVG